MRLAEQIREIAACWQSPGVPADIPCGDMPGDRIHIHPDQIRKADILFSVVLEKLFAAAQCSAQDRVVLCFCGGSGVGKSGIASVLAYYLNQAGVGTYILSGDNYPRRIPQYNDAERLHLFREAGLKAMVKADSLTPERFEKIQKWQQEASDADPKHAEENAWFADYLAGGREGLRMYLGTPLEIGYEDLQEVVDQFHSGTENIWLKRMGRTDDALWYEKKDFSAINVLIIEWTHGNSDYYQGVDVPILLNSTPQETMEYRRARGRDGAADSPFTTMVLEIEQKKLHEQAHKAQIIMAKNGELLSYEQYCAIMENGR